MIRIVSLRRGFRRMVRPLVSGTKMIRQRMRKTFNARMAMTLEGSAVSRLCPVLSREDLLYDALKIVLRGVDNEDIAIAA
jgi:hypothetical protein